MHDNIKFKTKSGSGIVFVVSSCILYWHYANFPTSKIIIQNLRQSFFKKTHNNTSSLIINKLILVNFDADCNFMALSGDYHER